MTDTCLHCQETVTDSEKEFGTQVNLATQEACEKRWVHRECYLRQVVGSIPHQHRQCYCFGGNIDDGTTMSRQESIEAVQHFEKYFNPLVVRLSDCNKRS